MNVSNDVKVFFAPYWIFAGEGFIRETLKTFTCSKSTTKNNRKRYKICSKLIKKTPKRRQ